MTAFNLKLSTFDEMWDECERVSGTTFGHNMIGIICNEAKERFGEDKADELYEAFQL